MLLCVELMLASAVTAIYDRQPGTKQHLKQTHTHTHTHTLQLRCVTRGRTAPRQTQSAALC